MQDKVQFILQRVLVKWIDSMDLSYQIRNPRKDLATGYLVAQMLARYFPKEVNIYSFHNSQASEKRHNNWQQLQTFLLKKEFNLSTQEYKSIANLAPKTAQSFLIRLYEFLTKKKYIQRPEQPVKPEQPGYSRPTAASLTKDRQINRIVDNERKKKQINMTLTKHFSRMKQDKYSSGLVEWLINKRKTMIEKQLREQEEELKLKSINVQTISEVKQIELKCFNSSTSKKSKNQLGQIMENKGVVDFLQESCLGILKKEPLNKEIKRLGLDFKEKQGSFKNILIELFKNSGVRDPSGDKKVHNKSLKVLMNQFMQPSEINLIVDNIQNNFADFRKFFFMLLQPLHVLKSTSKTLVLLLELINQIANNLNQRDVESTKLNFEAILLKPLLQIFKTGPAKKSHVVSIMFSFMGSNQENLYQFIRKSKSHLGSIPLFLTLLAQILEQLSQRETIHMHPPLWTYLFNQAFMATREPSPHTRTKGLKVLNELVLYNKEGMLEKLDKLCVMSKDCWWQVRAQLLILLSKLIIVLPQVQVKALPLIYQLFNKNVSHNILRIGLIRLAELLHKQPALCDRYLEILLEIGSDIRKDMLNVADIRFGEVVLGFQTFVYQLTGAPNDWNSIGIGQAMHRYTVSHGLSQFDFKHLQALNACLYRELKSEDGGLWIEIYDKLKVLLFNSLQSDQICSLARNILKRLFTFESIQQYLIKSSHSNFQNLFVKIYQLTPNPLQSSGELLNLLKFLNSTNNAFKQYSYRLIKEFSESHKDWFLQSNLVEFMNQLAKERRNGVFE